MMVTLIESQKEVTSTTVIHQNLLDPFLTKLKEKRSALLLALGDSNMDNTNFTRGAKQWPELLHTELKIHYETHRLLLLNAAISGNTVLDVLNRFDSDVSAHLPSLTLFCIGSNDAEHLSDDIFKKGYLECLDRLEALGAPILVFTPPPIMERKPEPPHIWREDVKRSRKVEMIRQMVANRNVTFVDLCQAMNDLEDAGQLEIQTVMEDEVHLNALGHQIVFRIFAPVFGLSSTLSWERDKPKTSVS